MEALKAPEPTKRPTVQRSPAYPVLDLASAIERARKFYNFEKRSAANVKVAVSHWGYGPASSGGKQTLAALLAFGLMVDEGSGDNRSVRLTDLAFRILLDDRPDSKERDAAVRRAAMMPKIHQDVLAKWPELEVSDANLKHYLLIDRKFNENGAKDFIKELRSTSAFAKLTVEPHALDEDAPVEDDKPLKIGDWVQWESGGAIQFSSKQVVWCSDDGAYARVEGNLTGLPVAELTIVAPPAPVAAIKHQEAAVPASPRPSDGGGQPKSAPPSTPRTGMKQDTFSFPGSDGLAVFQWPSTMTMEEFEDLAAWIEIKLRGIKRSI